MLRRRAAIGNDEPIAAQLAGLPSLTFVGVFALPFVWTLYAVVITIEGSVRRRAGYVLLLAVITLFTPSGDVAPGASLTLSCPSGVFVLS